MWLGPRHHAAPAVRPSQGITAQNVGVPILLVIFFYIRLSFHIRERLASAHGLLPGLFFLMVVLLMTEGDLLFLLSAQGLAVGAVGRGSAVLHGISTLTALQTAAKPDQMVRKATMPTSVPSRSSQAGYGQRRIQTGRQDRYLFLPPSPFQFCTHLPPPRDSVSNCSSVGYSSFPLETSRKRAVWAAVCRSSSSSPMEQLLSLLLAGTVLRYHSLRSVPPLQFLQRQSPPGFGIHVP